ncbi:mechanosensitive ion channel family protein [Halorientalis pallida]|uniref:Mechanosensitive ion channel family protein n=1 Tax=Halorientalis pallida TaxID=2479928 RepID=A0A498L052_9EURY|nr:mechanosensitive ion channel family protein [Halorientalis pallida]RXK51658.1 mechanosensitive ion channel family protein [Halorientalis pallida]
MPANLSFVAQFGSVLGRLSSTEGRLLASVGLALAAITLAALVVPLLLRQGRRLVARRYLGGTIDDFVGQVNDRFPVTTPVVLLLRSLQVGISLVTGLTLLVIWDQQWLIAQAYALVQFSLADVLAWVFTGVLVVGAYVGMGLLEDAVAAFSREADRMTAHQEQIVTRVGQIGLLVVVAFVLLGFWGVDLGGLLVGAGFLGIVVGLAARQTLGSLIAGFVLMFSRPFEIGDWVEVGDEEGVVTDITIINTRLENFDGEFVVIPNDRVADRAITNRSQKGRLRLRVDVGIDYDADPAAAAEVATAAIETVDHVEETPKPHVFPREFGDSAVVLEMRFWIEHPTPPKRWRTQARVVERVKAAFGREGIGIPFPQRELSGRAETGGVRVDDERSEPVRTDGADRDGTHN